MAKVLKEVKPVHFVQEDVPVLTTFTENKVFTVGNR
jgi:hypothetical protein